MSSRQILRILSLGAGVQSTTVLLMALAGELEPFDHVIFSDTGWEPSGVYEHLERLKAYALTHGVTIETVTAGNIRTDHLNPVGEHLFIRNPRKRPDYLGRGRTSMPFYTVGDKLRGPDTDEAALFDDDEYAEEDPGGTRKGHTRRTCTKTYKIEPVERRIREILGLSPGQRWPTEHRIDQTFGISWDENERESKSLRPAIINRYPLIDRRMTRDDCHEWLAAHGWTAPRSACIGCPFHRDDEWRRMRDQDPSAWADAIDFDERFRDRALAGAVTLDDVPYLHDSRVPLRVVDIDAPPALAEQGALFESTFGAACEGFCGT